MTELAFWVILIGIILIVLAVYMMKNVESWSKTKDAQDIRDLKIKISTLEEANTDGLTARTKLALRIKDLEEKNPMFEGHLRQMREDYWVLREKIANKKHLHLHKPLEVVKTQKLQKEKK